MKQAIGPRELQLRQMRELVASTKRTLADAVKDVEAAVQQSRHGRAVKKKLKKKRRSHQKEAVFGRR